MLAGFGACVFAFVLAGGCKSASSASSTLPCNEDPLQCTGNDTCWIETCTPLPASSCTHFDFACLAAKPRAMLGQNCENSVGVVTCGPGEACVQEMNVNDGYGICSTYCDPATVGFCPQGFSCVEVGVALVASAPIIHVCQQNGSDAGPLTIGDTGTGPTEIPDAGLDVRDHLLFDALPP